MGMLCEIYSEIAYMYMFSKIYRQQSFTAFTQIVSDVTQESKHRGKNRTYYGQTNNHILEYDLFTLMFKLGNLLQKDCPQTALFQKLT